MLLTRLDEDSGRGPPTEAALLYLVWAPSTISILCLPSSAASLLLSLPAISRQLNPQTRSATKAPSSSTVLGYPVGRKKMAAPFAGRAARTRSRPSSIHEGRSKPIFSLINLFDLQRRTTRNEKSSGERPAPKQLKHLLPWAGSETRPNAGPAKSAMYVGYRTDSNPGLCLVASYGNSACRTTRRRDG
jgi:hypothetical protein